jgi:hypothetical protein
MPSAFAKSVRLLGSFGTLRQLHCFENAQPPPANSGVSFGESAE